MVVLKVGLGSFFSEEAYGMEGEGNRSCLSSIWPFFRFCWYKRLFGNFCSKFGPFGGFLQTMIELGL